MRAGSPLVCLGETLVDLVSERPVASLTSASAFTPRFGGSQANVAVGASRFGAAVTMLGGAGADAWGGWLRDTLAAEGVDISRFELVEGAETPHAFVALSPAGEPDFSFYGDGDACVAAAAGQLADAFAAPNGVLAFGSDTLIGERARAVTHRARALAVERGWRFLFDPNLRPRRWTDVGEMQARVREQVSGCAVVKTNLEEATALSGEASPEAATEALRAMGADAAVVTAGADGALVAAGGGVRHVPAIPARAVDATGAGDSVTAVLGAALAAGAHARSLVEIVELAMATAARVVETLGALPGLPPANEARASLAQVLRAPVAEPEGEG